MNFGLFVIGLIIVAVGLHWICKGALYSNRGRPMIWRDQDPQTFWTAVLIQIAIGMACVVGSFFFKPMALTRPGKTQTYATTPRTRAPALASVTAMAPATSPATTLIVESPNDLRIKSRLIHRGVDIMDGREFKTALHFRRSDQSVGLLIDQLYNAGAARVLLDPMGPDGLVSDGPVICVELPAKSHRRSACLAAISAFEKSSPRSRISADSPTTERYIEIDVGR